MRAPSRLALPVLALCLAASCAPEAERRRAEGAVRLRRGDLSGALQALRAAVKADPSDGAAWLQLGHALFEAQRYDEAERSYRPALERGAGRDARRALAQLALRRGRPGEAERLLRALLDEAPRDLDARLAVGALLLGRRDFAAAEAAYRPAARTGHWAGLYGLGRSLLARGATDEARAAFEALEAAAPDHPYGAYGRALAAAQLGRTDEVCQALRLAFERGLGDGGAVERDRALAPARRAPCLLALLEARR